MSTKWFDPRDLLFKSPFGAVPCGADVSFCFRPERGAAVTRCELLAHGEFADQWTTVELTPAQEDGHVVYRGIFTAPDDVELVWYHFRLSWADGGTSCYGKKGLCAWDAVEPWQLTVYDDTHKTPAWFGRGVTYQIFPDRFRRAKSRDVAGLVGPRTLHENWDELPEYRPNAEGEITCSDFFGGDLQGITEKLDYLASLGVTTLYLCPIFEASTNHRYDTACYERIDPLLGDEADFRTLCAEAKKRGIYVMLDGVFNHTGRKSVYFNADSFYDDLGAAQGEQSPYYRWYNFHPFPDEYDAWNLEKYYRRHRFALDGAARLTVAENSPVCCRLHLERAISRSQLVQDITLYPHSRRIDFETWVDWHEHQHLLKVHFPVDIHTDEATFDIQFGNLKRKITQNTSWDVARFESCGQKWMDMSEGHYGVSMLNDCKYGHSALDGVMTLTLIKSGIEPNPTADQEEHTFTYALYPHAEGWRQAKTVQEAMKLNQPALSAEGGCAGDETSFVWIDKQNVIIETVKEAEDGDGVIIRLYESENARTKAHISFEKPVASVESCDCVEKTKETVCVAGDGFDITIKPYEIQTYRVRF